MRGVVFGAEELVARQGIANQQQVAHNALHVRV